MSVENSAGVMPLVSVEKRLPCSETISERFFRKKFH